MSVRPGLFLGLFFSAAALSAQSPASPLEKPALVNAGAPIRIEYECSGADMLALGLHCTAEEPCPVYLELTAVEPAGARLFMAGNIHTESTTLFSVLLASSDGGKTWNELFERLRGASLDRIQFFDAETGWVGGQIVQPLPRDPFFLLSADGGATWRRRPVFSESRPGAIERFQFDGRTNGVLWIDRSQSGESGAVFERYETTTGGDSWTLREALNRPPASTSGLKDNGWRLRADRATQSYRLERRAEDQWQQAAAFLIPLGACEPEIQRLPEPSPEPPVSPPETPPPPPRKKK